MSVSTLVQDRGSKTRRVEIKNATTQANVAAWHTALQALIVGKVLGSEFIEKFGYTSAKGAGAFDNISARAEVVMSYFDGTNRIPMKFALRCPKEAQTEYNADRGCYQLTAAAGEIIRAAIETVCGYDADSVTYVSGYLYDKRRKAQ